jgi:hypothetical protein
MIRFLPMTPRLSPAQLRILFVFGCSLALGCAGEGLRVSALATPPPVSAAALSAAAPTPDLSAVPDWALANPATSPESVIGIGSGSSLDGATRYALQDVASRLSVSIESQLRDSYSETNGTTVESLEQVIETRVTGARFTGWKRTRAAERAGVFWAEVRIDRRRLARDSKSELVRVARDVDLQLESAKGSALRRLLALQSTSRDRERASNLIALIDVLDSEFDRDSWEARRADWRSIDEAARRALVFEVRADPASREIANWVESRLVSERLRTRSGECSSKDAICIDIRSEITEADVASRHIARIRSTVAVLEPDGGVVQESDLVGRGDSKSDRARARRKALDDLRQSLAGFSVLDGLIGP